jgi:hypothetical protein
MHTKDLPTKIFFMFYPQVINQHVNIYNFNHHQLITKASRTQYKSLHLFDIFSIIPTYTYINTFTTLNNKFELIHFGKYVFLCRLHNHKQQKWDCNG